MRLLRLLGPFRPGYLCSPCLLLRQVYLGYLCNLTHLLDLLHRRGQLGQLNLCNHVDPLSLGYQSNPVVLLRRPVYPEYLDYLYNLNRLLHL